MIVRTIHGRDSTPYLTRIKLTPLIFGRRLMLHIFHRPDLDTFHDHPFDFWTLPLSGGYIEECLTYAGEKKTNRVRRWRITGRHWFHTHRILYWRDFEKRKLVTLVWHRGRRRNWGFWVPCTPIQALSYHLHGRDMRGNYRFVPWEEFLGE